MTLDYPDRRAIEWCGKPHHKAEMAGILEACDYCSVDCAKMDGHDGSTVLDDFERERLLFCIDVLKGELIAWCKDGNAS
jgi:hypothetical protein